MRFFPLSIIWFFLCPILFLSCKNDGEIGNIYGQWKVTSINIGDSIVTPIHDLYLAFQNDCSVARIARADTHYTMQYVGSFLLTEDSLFLSYYIDESSNGSDVAHFYLSNYFCFSAPHDNIRLSIIKLNRKGLVFTDGGTAWFLTSF